MANDAREITRLTDAFQSELEAGNGRAWKAAFSELQMPYKEFAIWILTWEDSDLAEVHAALRKLIAPLLPQIVPVRTTVAYLAITEGVELQRDFLDGPEEIMQEGRAFREVPLISGPAEASIFRGMDSRR